MDQENILLQQDHSWPWEILTTHLFTTRGKDFVVVADPNLYFEKI